MNIYFFYNFLEYRSLPIHGKASRRFGTEERPPLPVSIIKGPVVLSQEEGASQGRQTPESFNKREGRIEVGRFRTGQGQERSFAHVLP